MKRFTWIIAALLATATFVACGDDDKKDDGDTGGFAQPAGTVVVNFTVDDSANKDWKANELEWKGQLQFDPTTRMGSYNSDWLAEAPGWAKLYDDGPWNQGTPPGHEPIGAVAGDNKWGVAVFMTPPAAGQPAITVNYGLRDATNADRANGGWVWLGSNPGSFTVNPGATGSINAPGQTFPAKGNVDMKLVIDKNAIAVTDPPFTTTVIKVKGSAWGWSDKNTYDDGAAGGHGDDVAGDGKFTFILSQNISTTTPPYPGLLKTGDKPEWVYVLDGVEYKVGGDASPTGVKAYVKAGAATTWTEVAVSQTAGGPFGKNTIITVP